MSWERKKMREKWEMIDNWQWLTGGDWLVVLPMVVRSDWFLGKKNKMKKRKWGVIKKMEKLEECGRRMERENVENEWKEMRLVGGESGSVWAKVKNNRRRKWRRMGKKNPPP